MNKDQTSPKLVRLLQCGRKSCGYVLADEERGWRREDIGQRAICPICANDDFYTLKANGQKVNYREMDEYRKGVDPNLIEATPRMGPKMRAYLRDAKKRILAMQTPTGEENE